MDVLEMFENHAHATRQGVMGNGNSGAEGGAGAVRFCGPFGPASHRVTQWVWHKNCNCSAFNPKRIGKWEINKYRRITHILCNKSGNNVKC